MIGNATSCMDSTGQDGFRRPQGSWATMSIVYLFIHLLVCAVTGRVGAVGVGATSVATAATDWVVTAAADPMRLSTTTAAAAYVRAAGIDTDSVTPPVTNCVMSVDGEAVRRPLLSLTGWSLLTQPPWLLLLPPAQGWLVTPLRAPWPLRSLTGW